jgi:hypothetical protein
MRKIGSDFAEHQNDPPRAVASSRGSRDPRQARVMSLQHAIGNRATARVLARDPQHTSGEPPEAPGTSTPLRLDVLSASTRKVLRNDSRDRILAALPFFVSAVKDNVAALKAEEKAKAEWATALIDMFIGIGAPIFAKLLVNRGGVTGRLAGKLSKATETTATVKHATAAKTAAEAAANFEQARQGLATAEAELAVAQKAKAAARGRRATKEADKARRDAEQAATNAAKRAAEFGQRAEKARKDYEALKPVELIGDTELLKETMKGLVSKVGGTALKQNVELLWGEDDVDAFAVGLQLEFHKGVTDVTHQLNTDDADHPDSEGTNFKDKQLIALWSAFDPEVTNVVTYREVLKDKLDLFKTWVHPIEATKATITSKWDNWHGTNTRAVWLNTPTGKELWLITEDWEAQPPRGQKIDRKWVGRIPHEMERFAIARTEAIFGPLESVDSFMLQIEQEAARREAEQKKAQAAEEARRRQEDQQRAEEQRRQYEILIKQHPEFGTPPAGAPPRPASPATP